MKRPSRAVVGWTALAVLGLVLAVGVSYAVSTIATTDSVGLSSEPFGSGTRLAPPSTDQNEPTTPASGGGRPSGTGTTPSTPGTTTSPPASEKGDDSGGGGGSGRGSGGGGDD